MATNNAPTITRQKIGDILEKEYAEDFEGHIEYFYFTVKVTSYPSRPMNIAQCKETVCSMLEDKYKGGGWKVLEDMTVMSPAQEDKTVKSEFSFQVFGKYQNPEATKRNVEQNLGGFRVDLEHMLVEKQPPKQRPSVRITVTRACMYNELDHIN